MSFEPLSERPMDAAPALLVNRTHRVVRERAKVRQARKDLARSLWIPLVVSFGLLVLLLGSAWNLLDEGEYLANGLPDALQQMMMLSLWCLPLSVVLLLVVGFRRAGKGSKARSLNEGS